MKYCLMAVFMILSLSMSVASCSTDAPIGEIEQPVIPDKPGSNETPDEPDDNNDDNNGNTDKPMNNNLKISIGAVTFKVSLEDNATVKAFKALLPMTIAMSDLNGNEKYYYLSGNLPTATSNPGTIHAGDLMLYGSGCMVLFYETFSSSYSYTPLGRVDNPSGLASALGSGSVTVTFELQ